jgi:hypothetical protein
MRAEGLEVECIDSTAGVYRLTAAELERLEKAAPGEPKSAGR